MSYDLIYHKLSVLCTNCDYKFKCMFPISYLSCGTENSPIVWCWIEIDVKCLHWHNSGIESEPSVYGVVISVYFY